MEEEFLKEYEKLCQKYKMGLKGCGCCGSPYLKSINEINYNEEFDCVFIGGDGSWHELEKKGELDDRERQFYEEEKTIQKYFNR